MQRWNKNGKKCAGLAFSLAKTMKGKGTINKKKSSADLNQKNKGVLQGEALLEAASSSIFKRECGARRLPFVNDNLA